MDNEIDDKSTRKEDCKLCQVNSILMAVGTAHTVCNLMKDKDSRDNCLGWIDNLNPEEIETAKDVYKGILQQAGDNGIDKLDEASKLFNLGAREAIFEHVNEKIARGEKPTEKEIMAYKQVMMSKRQ